MTAMTQADLMKFCGTDPSIHQERIRQPFNGGDWTYATDGRIVVRVPRQGDWPASYPAGAEIIDGYFTAASDTSYQPLPVIDLPPIPAYVPKPCKECAGTGHVHVATCTKCHGSGMTVCHACQHEDDCEECNGSGTIDRPATTEDDPAMVIDCESCDGTGDLGDPDARPIVYTRVGPYWIDRHYVVLMQGLPGLRLDMNARQWWASEKPQSGEWRPVTFTFDGGNGAIVPLRQKPEPSLAPSDAHEGEGA